MKIRFTLLSVSVGMMMSPAFADETVSEPHVELEPMVISVSGVGRSLQKGAGSVTSISSKEMSQIGATSMADIVKYQPLVSAPSAVRGTGNAWDTTGTTGYNIRGMDGNRVGLDVDGVELPDATSKPDRTQNNSYGMGRDYIDPEMFREVRIQAGSTDARTDGLAGRVSFLTKKPSDYVSDDKHFAYGYKVGYDGADKSVSHAVHTAVGNDKLRGLLVYSRRDGEEAQANTSTTLNQEDWKSDAVLFSMQYRPNDNHEFGAVMDYYKKTGESVLDTAVLSTQYPNGGVQHTNIKRVRYGLEHQYTPTNPMLFDKLSTQLFYQTAENGNTTNAYYLQSRSNRNIATTLNTDTYGIKLLADKLIETDKLHHKIQYGMDASRTDEERPWTDTATAVATNVTTVTKNNRMPSMETDKFAIHVSDKMTMDLAGRELTIAPQLRYVYQKHKPTDLSNYLPTVGLSNEFIASTVTSSTSDYFSPGLMLSYQLTPEVLGYAKYNRSARLPTSSEKTGSFGNVVTTPFFSMKYVVLGNPNLKAETSDAFELGFKGKLTDGVEFALSGFYNKYANYIEYKSISLTGFNPAYQVTNIADVDIWGGELGLKVDLGKFIRNSDGFSVVMGAGTSDYKATDNTGERTYVDSILPAKATLGFSYDDPNSKYGMGLTSTFVAGKRSDAGESYYRAGGYHVMDLATYWNVNKNIRLNVGINNLFNRKYHDYATVSGLSASETVKIERATMPERNVGASLVFNF